MRALLLLLISLAGASASAQDPLRSAEAALERERWDVASSALSDALLATPSAERGALLDRAWGMFRPRGASAALLDALDRAIDASGTDPVLRYYRGELRADLKMLGAAREDFEVVARRDPSVRGRLAFLSFLAFRHDDAARLSSDLGPEWKAFHHRQASLAADLERAPRRQWMAVFGGLILVGVLASRLLRGSRTAPAEG